MKFLDQTAKTNWIAIVLVGIAAFILGAGIVWVTGLQNEITPSPAEIISPTPLSSAPPAQAPPESAGSSITVISPNGGEAVQEGEPYIIQWNNSPEVQWVRVMLYASNYPNVEKAGVSTAFAVADISNRELAQRGYMRWTPERISSAGLDLTDYRYFKVEIQGYTGVTSDNQLTGFTSMDVSDNSFSIVF